MAIRLVLVRHGLSSFNEKGLLQGRTDDSYLTPHLNQRSVSTASSVQVRSPINSKSIGGWKNYKDMLKPAIEILTQTDKYQDIPS